MIDIEYIRRGYIFCLQVRGHAGAAPYGQDLVCCAVSTLVQTLALRVLELQVKDLADSPEVDLTRADAWIKAVSVPERDSALRGAFETIITGLQALAQQWPQYVSLCFSEG